MPKYVEIDGVGEVEFPDEMDELAIQGAIERDILKTAPPPPPPPPPPVAKPPPPAAPLPYMPTGPNTAGPIQGGYKAPHDPIAEARGFAYLQQQAAPPAAPQGPYVPPPSMPGDVSAYELAAPPPPPQQNLFRTPEMAGRQAAGGAPSFMGAVGDAVTFLSEPLRPLTAPFIKGKSYPQEVGERIIDSEKSHKWKKLPEQEKTAILDRARFKFQKGETLSAAEEDAILQDAGFWENVQAFAQQFKDHPEPSIRELAGEIINEGPVFAIGSKGVGAFAKASRQALKTQRQAARLAGAKKTLHADRLAGKQGAAPARVLERFAQAEQSAAGRARTVEGLTKANLAKQMGEEAFEEGVTEGAIEAAQAEAAGRDALSPQQAAEVAIGGALGAGFGAGKFAVDPRMSGGRFEKIRDRLVFPEGIEKNEGIQTQLRQVEAAGEGRLAKHRVRIEADEEAGARFRKGDQAPAGYEHLADPEGKLLHDLGEGGKFDAGSGRIRVTRDSDESTLPEEYIHAGQEALRQEAAAGDRAAKVLQAKIARWERQVSRDRTDLPTGDELFGQALNVTLGHGDKYEGVIREIRIPEDLVEEFTTFIGGEKVRQGLSGVAAPPRPAAIATAEKLPEGDVKALRQELEPPPRSSQFLEPMPAEGDSPAPAYTREEWRQGPFQLKKKESTLQKLKRQGYYRVLPSEGADAFSVDPAALDEKVLSKISNLLKVKGYDIRGAEDARALLTRQLGDKKVMRHADWKEAVEKAIGYGKADKKADAKYEHSSVFRKAARHFGKTEDFREAGYILPNGAMLDFSGKKEDPYQRGKRAYDHREIGAAFEDDESLSGTDGMNKFMTMGAIRYLPESNAVNLNVPPSPAQKSRIATLMRNSEEPLLVELGEGRFHREYPPKTSPERIFRDIAKIFNGEDPGELPASQRYRYQLKKKREEKIISKAQRDKNFKKWFKGSKVTDEDGVPKVVYHGTTHDFTEFSKERGNIENHYGNAFYFTDSEVDVGRNYAGEGPDLTSRIERRAELLENDFPNLSLEARMRKAKKELKGPHGGAVMPVFLNLKNPVVIEKGGGTFFEYTSDEESGEEGGGLSDLYYAIQRVGDTSFGAGADRLWSDIVGDDGFDGLSAWEIDKRMRNSETLMYQDDEDGNLNSSELIREIWEEAGFDGIIQKDADQQFKKMGMNYGTTHYVAFKPEQIKSSTGNRGTFDPKNKDIRYQLKQAPEKTMSPADWSRKKKEESDKLALSKPVQGPERQENFRKWFRDSKVVDEKGKPQVVYHGTRSDFDTPSGVFFASDMPDVATEYSAAKADWARRRNGGIGGENVMPVYMSLQNPLIIEGNGVKWNAIPWDGGTKNTNEIVEEARKQGYDGVIFRNIRDHIWHQEDSELPDSPHDVFAAFKANQVKSATGNRGTFSPSKGDVRFQLKKLPNGEEVPENVPPFYSALYKTIEAKMGGKGRPDEIMKMIKAQPGIKPEELEWTGLEKWFEKMDSGIFKGKPIMKHEVLNFLKEQDIEIKELQRANSGVKWETYTLPGGKGYRELEFMLPEGYAERKYGPPQKRKAEYWVMEEGGSYHVVRAVHDGHALWKTFDTKYEAENEAEKLNGELPLNKAMKFPGGTHFPEDNVLAFTRFKTRKTRDGKRVLFIEELQSDWFQRMRDEGAITPTTADEARMAAQNADVLLDQIARAFKAKMKEEHGTDPELGVVRSQLTDMWKQGRTPPEKSIPAEAWKSFSDLMEERYSKNAAVRAGAPDAPFKDTWHELALKRLLRLAAEEGYDVVAWADAQTHFQRWGGTLMTWELADRLEAPGGKAELAWDIHYKSQVDGRAGGFDLEREAERLEGDGRYKLTTGGSVKNFNQFRELTENQLTSHQQRQLWKKIQASPRKGSFVGRKEGYDFFYDKAIPQFMGKFAKKLDPEAKLDKYEVELDPPKTASPPARRQADADEDGEYYYESREGDEAGYYIVPNGEDVDEATDGPYTSEDRAQEAVYDYLRESREQDYSIEEIRLEPDEGRFQLEERQVGNEVRYFIVDREKVDEEAAESPDLLTGEMRYLPAPPETYTMSGSFPVGDRPVKMSADISGGILDEDEAKEILDAVREDNGEPTITYRVEGDGAEWADEEDRTFETENEAREWMDNQISFDIENDDFYSIEYSERPEWVVYDPAGGEVSVHADEGEAESAVEEQNQRLEDERKSRRALTVRNMGIL